MNPEDGGHHSLGPIDYLSQHSLAPHERVGYAGASSVAPGLQIDEDALGTPSAASLKQRVDQLKGRIAAHARLVSGSEERATFMDLVRFIDTGAEAIEAIEILSDLIGPERAHELRELRREAARFFPAASR